MSITFTAGDRWCNFANTNALDLLSLVGLPVDYCGSVEPDALPRLLSALLRARNVSGARAHLVRETFSEGRVHIGGNTDEQTQRRLSELLELAAHAQRERLPITWG